MNVIVQIILVVLIASCFQIYLENAYASIVFSNSINKGDDMYLIFLSDNADKRILGDRKANYNEWKFMVLLTNVDESKVCSGTLVSKNFVLTSAWCVAQRKANQTKIFVSYNLHALRQQDLVCCYGLAFIHPSYQYGRYGIRTNDIALIRLDLELPIEKSKLVRLEDIASYGVNINSPDNKNFKVASWAINNIIFPSSSGNTEIHFNSKASLYEINQKWTNVQHCVSLLGIPAKHAEKFICTKTHRMLKSVGALFGDGGSPLMSNDAQIGIAIGPTYRTSLEKCGLSIWTNVGPYIDWIDETIQTHQIASPQGCREDCDTMPSLMEKIDTTCRKFKLYSCNKKRGNDQESDDSSPNPKLLFSRNGTSIFNSSNSTSDEFDSLFEKIYGHSDSLNQSICETKYYIGYVFPNLKLIKLYEIEVGIVIFCTVLLFFRICG